MDDEKDIDLVPLRLRQDVELENSSPGSGLGGYFVYFTFFLGFFAFFMFVSQIYLEKHQQILKHKEEIADLSKELSELQLKNESLYRRIEELKTTVGQEKIAREKLHWIKPGEKVVVWEDEP